MLGGRGGQTPGAPGEDGQSIGGGIGGKGGAGAIPDLHMGSIDRAVIDHRTFEYRFAALVRSFPVLERYAPGVSTWRIDLATLDAWAAHAIDDDLTTKLAAEGKSPRPGEGARDAARFVLHVWDSQRAWRCGRFDLFHALATWDSEQRAAFNVWIASGAWRP
jgi:hypothetical protein